MRKKTILCFLFPVLFFLTTCGREEMRQTIPYAPVNFTIDLNRFDHSLNNPFTYKIFREQDKRNPRDLVGLGGLLIVSRIDNNQLFAFDLACPCSGNPNVTVTPNNEGEAFCATCNSVFITSFGLGTVRSGNAPAHLQRYRVFQQREGVFVVRH